MCCRNLPEVMNELNFLEKTSGKIEVLVCMKSKRIVAQMFCFVVVWTRVLIKKGGMVVLSVFWGGFALT